MLLLLVLPFAIGLWITVMLLRRSEWKRRQSLLSEGSVHAASREENAQNSD